MAPWSQCVMCCLAVVVCRCTGRELTVLNCSGELAEDLEPTHVGADLIAGSLIKVRFLDWCGIDCPVVGWVWYGPSRSLPREFS